MRLNQSFSGLGSSFLRIQFLTQRRKFVWGSSVQTGKKLFSLDRLI